MNNGDLIDQMYAWIFSALKALGKFCLHYSDATEKAELAAEPGVVFSIFFGILFFFGSACFAASIAQARRYNPWPFFLLGLIIPWITPLLMIFFLDLKGNREMRATLNKIEKEEQQKAAEEERKAAEIAEKEAAAGIERAKSWGPEYFNTIYRKEDGSYAGPWDASYKGRQVHVLRILEVLPEVLYVEISASHGETSKIRIPYGTLESWEDAESIENTK